MTNNSHIKTKMYKHGDSAHSEDYAKESNVIYHNYHGGDANAARNNDYAINQWIGTVQPDNKATGDWYLDLGATPHVIYRWDGAEWLQIGGAGAGDPEVQELGEIAGNVSFDISDGQIVKATLTDDVNLTVNGTPDAGHVAFLMLEFSDAKIAVDDPPVSISFTNNKRAPRGTLPDHYQELFQLNMSVDENGKLTVSSITDGIEDIV